MNRSEAGLFDRKKKVSAWARWVLNGPPPRDWPVIQQLLYSRKYPFFTYAILTTSQVASYSRKTLLLNLLSFSLDPIVIQLFEVKLFNLWSIHFFNLYIYLVYPIIIASLLTMLCFRVLSKNPIEVMFLRVIFINYPHAHCKILSLR